MGKGSRNQNNTGVQTPLGRTGNRGLPDTSAIVEKTVANIIAHLPSDTEISPEEMQQLKAAVEKMAQSSSRTDSLVVHAFTAYQDVADSMMKQLTQQVLAGLNVQPEVVAAQKLMGVQVTNASLANAAADIAKEKLRSALELWNEPELEFTEKPQPPVPRRGPPKPKPF